MKRHSGAVRIPVTAAAQHVGSQVTLMGALLRRKGQYFLVPPDDRQALYMRWEGQEFVQDQVVGLSGWGWGFAIDHSGEFTLGGEISIQLRPTFASGCLIRRPHPSVPLILRDLTQVVLEEQGEMPETRWTPETVKAFAEQQREEMVRMAYDEAEREKSMAYLNARLADSMFS